MILDSFKVNNLFNEVDLDIKFVENRLIIVSENGSGKTTILRMLYLFVSKQWAKLTEIEFESIEANINNKSYVFNRNNFNDKLFDEDVYQDLAKEYPTYKTFILDVLPGYDSDILKRNNPILEDIENQYDVPKTLLLSLIDRLNELLFDKNIYDWNTSVIYLPTYRRIERNFLQLFGDMDKRLEIYLKSLLPELNTRILDERGYNENFSDTEEDLKRVFSDIWDLIDNEKWKKEKKEFEILELVEFGMNDVKLKVSNVLKEIEEGSKELIPTINEFKSCCDKYLTNGKTLGFKEKSRNIIVNINNDKEVGLDDLSSGEKQIVSIFCHLFLGINKPLVIIDEPELSLSIDWQESILSDILKSSNNGLIVATHSPFIVNDDLKKFTHGLNEFIL
ncbi:AAA family ATPase [Tenacibaculum maritimum]|uniref:AAA family ATPase n=1 Tax=Tenacibaculum maritimum TaxID=107401 RepID=UPI0012E591B7|nr:AAA family ATPase [Tenacibaculum maritimum]CAA0176204.1 conserved hypothetical protein [Tenacibaculum maritimum]